MTFGVKIRPALKKSNLFHKLEEIKSWYCKNNYNLQKEGSIVYDWLTRFWVWIWFWIFQGTEQPRILNMSLVLNVPEFGIYQGSEYAYGFEYVRILNKPEFWKCQGYTGFRICLNNSWIFLKMPDYVWIFLNMPEYACYLNVFCFTFSPWLHYITRGYLFERLQETRG